MFLSEPLSSLLCSIQRALIGNITPNLRAVYASITDNTYGIIFYYDQPLSEDEEELASLTDTEFISDFPSPDYKTSYIVEVIPYPKPIPKKGFCVYERYEKNLSNDIFHEDTVIPKIKTSNINLLTSMMDALWGTVTPNLRAAYVELVENSIILHFYYASPLSEKEIELSESATRKMIANFPAPIHIDCQRHVVEMPNRITFKGLLVYFRYEPSNNDC